MYNKVYIYKFNFEYFEEFTDRRIHYLYPQEPKAREKWMRRN